MRLRNALAILSLLACTLVSTAHASVRASGLLCTGAGAAELSKGPNGQGLHLSGLDLGHTGLLVDGADIALSHLEGHHIRCASSWGPSDAGVVCSFSFTVRNTGTASTGSLSTGRCALTRTPDGLLVSTDLSRFGSSPTKTCLLYLGGSLVTRFVCPSSFDLSSGCPTCSVAQIPEVSLEFSQRGPRQTVSSFVSSVCPMRFSSNGSTYSWDLMVVTGDCDDADRFSLDVCSVRCAVPPSSSLSSLDFDSQSTVWFGHAITVLRDLDQDGFDDNVRVGVNPFYDEGRMTVTNPLYEQVFGRGGAGGSSAVPFTLLDTSSDPASLRFSPSSPFVLDPATDEGASLDCRVTGTGTCSPTGEVASLRTSIVGGACVVSSRFSSMCATDETVVVSSHGVVVATLPVALDGSVVVQPAPGSPSFMAINEKGLCHCPAKPVKNTQAELGSPNPSASFPSSRDVSIHLAFADPRVFLVGGQRVTGDELQFTGRCASGACSNVMTVTGTDFSLHRCSSGSCSSSSSSLSVMDISSGGIDQIFADIPSSVAISSSSPVVQVPVVFDRVNATPTRGTTVNLRLSSNLLLAGPPVEGNYFSSHGASAFLVVDNPDGSHTVDMALLGPGCGPTTGGTLFSISVQRAPGAADGIGFVSIDAAEAADCNAGPVPASPGGKSFIVLDGTPPAAVSSLALAQVKFGNDADGTTQLALSALLFDPTVTVELYRASYLNYPEYDDGPFPGSVPPSPSYPPSGRYGRVKVQFHWDRSSGALTAVDEPVSRDVYYYVCYAVDRAGNVSPPSNLTSGRHNYSLGDVSNGLAVCSGVDNQVTTADISALASHYGQHLAVGSPYECLDVGPTDDGGVDGRPLTDHLLSFRDLLMYAINYLSVSAPAARPRPMAAATDALRLRVPPLPGVGQTFDVAVEMSGAGDAQGLSAQLAFDPAVVEPLAVSSGGLILAQDREGVVLSAQPGNVDAALLGVGVGLSGEGDLARVTFRVKGAGDPALGIANAEARDAQNRLLALSGAGAPGATPGRTALRMAFPNPFDKSTTVVLSLHAQGPASVRVFDVAGRTVRTLLQGVQPAGERLLAWDGRDDSGTKLGAGVYMLRLEAGGHSETRAVRLIK